MSYNFPILENKHKHPKVYFEQYLSNFGEPADDIANDSPAELEAELLENSFFMKQRVRRIARRIRNRIA